MEPPTFWDDLEARFLGLQGDLDGRELAATMSLGGWTISEGEARDRAVFRSLATQAAIGGDLVTGDESPVDVWLDRLRQGPLFHVFEGSGTIGGETLVSDGGYINFLCRASADCCGELKSEAVRQRAATTALEAEALESETRDPVTTSDSVLARSENVFRRTPEGWSISYAGETASGLKHRVGMEVIRTLLQNPSLPGVERTDLTSVQLDSSCAESFVGNGDPAFDLEFVKDRKREIGEEYDQAMACGDVQRAATAEQGRRELEDFVIRNVDRRGRPRAVGSEAETVRKRVWKQYTDSLDAIRTVAPSFARHLDDKIRKGHTWSYGPEVDMNWKT